MMSKHRIVELPSADTRARFTRGVPVLDLGRPPSAVAGPEPQRARIGPYRLEPDVAQGPPPPIQEVVGFPTLERFGLVKGARFPRVAASPSARVTTPDRRVHRNAAPPHGASPGRKPASLLGALGDPARPAPPPHLLMRPELGHRAAWVHLPRWDGARLTAERLDGWARQEGHVAVVQAVALDPIVFAEGGGLLGLLLDGPVDYRDQGEFRFVVIAERGDSPATFAGYPVLADYTIHADAAGQQAFDPQRAETYELYWHFSIELRGAFQTTALARDLEYAGELTVEIVTFISHYLEGAGVGEYRSVRMVTYPEDEAETLPRVFLDDALGLPDGVLLDGDTLDRSDLHLHNLASRARQCEAFADELVPRMQSRLAEGAAALHGAVRAINAEVFPGRRVSPRDPAMMQTALPFALQMLLEGRRSGLDDSCLRGFPEFEPFFEELPDITENKDDIPAF